MAETIITIIAVALSVAASILVIRLLLNDKTFVFNCQHYGAAQDKLGKLLQGL